MQSSIARISPTRYTLSCHQLHQWCGSAIHQESMPNSYKSDGRVEASVLETLKGSLVPGCLG